MANAKIKWNQRVAGRAEGDIETVEIDTPFMRGALKNRRFTILELVNPPKISAKPKPAPPKVEIKKDDGQV